MGMGRRQGMDAIVAWGVPPVRVDGWTNQGHFADEHRDDELQFMKMDE